MVENNVGKGENAVHHDFFFKIIENGDCVLKGYNNQSLVTLYQTTKFLANPN